MALSEDDSSQPQLPALGGNFFGTTAAIRARSVPYWIQCKENSRQRKQCGISAPFSRTLKMDGAIASSAQRGTRVSPLIRAVYAT